MTIENFIGQYKQKLALHGEEEAMKMTLESFAFYVKRETEKMTFREKFQIAVSSKIAPRLQPLAGKIANAPCWEVATVSGAVPK